MTRTQEYTDYLAAFQPVAALYAERPAIVDGDLTVTFGELWSMVEQRAESLRSAGLERGDRVALVAENSAYYLASALAVWRAGGVLVTVYPSAGASDLQYSVELGDPALILTDGRVDLSVLDEQGPAAPTASIVDFDVTQVRRDAEPTPAPVADKLAMICFSSGTTSRPKAIMVTPHTIHNCAETYAEVWHLGPADVTAVALPMAWMYGLVSTSLSTLLRGGTVVVLRRARPELIAEAVMTHGVTFLPGVTTMFVKLVEYMASDTDRIWFPTLRLCIAGGEPRNETVFERWRAVTGCAVLDAYCASECLPLVTYDPLRDPVPLPGSAGKLVPRALLRVVDADGHDVAPGEVGEALSSGPGVMLGYWRDEEQTRAALTEDGWYRTQDLVRVDEDGYVHVVGRLSDLIIRGGTNISPAEVERVLREHPGIGDVAVVGLPDAVYGQEVVAAIVPGPGGTVNDAELSSFARERLAPYKVPTSFVTIDALPVSETTGKVSRKHVAASLLAERAHQR
ncbi:class I adenylate-forming enzyme family protein [Streptomyces sp. NPDC047042]|uniref:class I adenylate-forming enzyme family protein n=1 Tax=Streptomyces sp. NPDC047042 TaxID=3154807 RepID=UPI0033D772A5